MATEIEVVRDVGYFKTREPRSSFSAVLREVAKVHGHATVATSALVREVAYLSDAAYPNFFPVLREVAYLKDAVLGTLTYSTVVREVARLNDAISYAVRSSESLHEVALLSGRVVGEATATLREVARLNDRIFWYGSPATVREVARLGDAAYPGTGALLREVAVLGDAISYNHRQVVVVREVAQLGDSTDYGVSSDAVLREVAVVHGWATPFVTWAGDGAVLRDVFYGDDRAVPPNSGRAYTCHIVSWGMSVYANYPFSTQARNFAAGQNLWRLDATKDYNTEIEAWLTTGKLDLGVSGGKRPTVLYASGSSLEPLTVTVTGDVDGLLAAYDYPLDLRDQRDYRNNKALLGKGFRSRYLQFRLRAPKYTAFRVLTAEVDLAASQRRVG